jgi:hypothetical protein
MSIYDVNIGLAIEQRINELDISRAEFGRRVNTAKQNVARILRKPSCDTADLVKYCEALEFNFFTLYCEKEIEEAKRNSGNKNVNGLVGDNNNIRDSVVGVSDSDAVTIKQLKEQLAEEKERSAKYWQLIENLSQKR